MTLVLSDIIDSARDADSAFAKQRVPDAVFARYLSRYQRQLVGRANEIRPGLISSQISIVFQLNSAPPQSVLGTIGAGQPPLGTAGGLPVTGPEPGSYSVTEQVVGNTVELGLSNANPLIAKTAVVSSTSNTLTAGTSVNWATNQFAGQYVQITDGTDVFDVRVIASNTSNTLTVSQNWAVNPDTTSLFLILSLSPEMTQETSAIMALPALGQRTAYLVKYDANGNQYLDLSTPLVGMFEQGITLPPHKALIDGVVYFTTGFNPLDTMPLTIVDRSNRQNAWGLYPCWTDNTSLYLIGQANDWQNVASIDIRYVPEPEDLTQLTDEFILPDSAEAVLVAAAAAFAAKRVYNAPDTPQVDVGLYVTEQMDAERYWLEELGSRYRSETAYTREVW